MENVGRGMIERMETLPRYYTMERNDGWTNYRYGSELMVVESYSENNMSASMIGRHLDRYWLGLASLDDLRTNTLESAAGMLVSQYAGL